MLGHASQSLAYMIHMNHGLEAMRFHADDVLAAMRFHVLQLLWVMQTC
jgi:hypothetical protein